MTVGYGFGLLALGLLVILVGGLAVWYCINNYLEDEE